MKRSPVSLPASRGCADDADALATHLRSVGVELHRMASEMEILSTSTAEMSRTRRAVADSKPKRHRYSRN